MKLSLRGGAGKREKQGLEMRRKKQDERVGTRKGSADNIREHGTEMPKNDELLMTRCDAFWWVQ